MGMKSQYHCRTTRPGSFAPRSMDQSLMAKVHSVKYPYRHEERPWNF